MYLCIYLILLGICRDFDATEEISDIFEWAICKQSHNDAYGVVIC